MGDASLTSVTEYLLTQPILSFVVSGCVALPLRVVREDSEGESGEEEEEEEEEEMREAFVESSSFDSSTTVAMLKLHCIHTRFVMSAYITYMHAHKHTHTHYEYIKLKMHE